MRAKRVEPLQTEPVTSRSVCPRLCEGRGHLVMDPWVPRSPVFIMSMSLCMSLLMFLVEKEPPEKRGVGEGDSNLGLPKASGWTHDH